MGPNGAIGLHGIQIFTKLTLKGKPPFLMLCRDLIVPLNSLLIPTIKYLGTDENILSLEALKNMNQFVASSLKHARKKRDTKAPVIDRKLNEGDSVLLKDHTTGVWDPRYTRDHQIVSF